MSPIWSTLVAGKRGDCEITPEDKVTLEREIIRLQEKGWDNDRIVRLLRNTEYFDNITPENVSCDRMAAIWRENGETY